MNGVVCIFHQSTIHFNKTNQKNNELKIKESVYECGEKEYNISKRHFMVQVGYQSDVQLHAIAKDGKT